jgi:hypothetical protein
LKVFLYALAAVSLTACSTNVEIGSPGDYITRNDFEAMAGWVSDGSSLTKDHAHSGIYSIKVDKDKEFGLTYQAPLGNVSPHKLRGLAIEAWVFMPSAKANGVLGMQVIDPAQNGQQIFGEGINLGEQVKEYNKWVVVRKEIMLPANVAYTHNLKVFLWRSGATEPVYVDDLSIKGIE